MAGIIVVGAGAMGVQIALLCALSGHDVNLVELDTATRNTALERASQRTSRRVASGKLDAAEAETALARIHVSSEVTTSNDVAFAIESVTEKREVKRSVLADLDKSLPPHTVLASNSSSFTPSSLHDGITHRERFLNIHFFNPVLSMKCVELITTPHTSPDVLERATSFVEDLGKIPILLKKEIPGFIANRILNAVRDEALRLYEGGYADIDMIDTACRYALGYPMGPFELMDLTGIDIGYHTKMARYEESGNPEDGPSATVRTLVERGDLGQKSGRGFYHYDADARRGEPAL